MTEPNNGTQREIKQLLVQTAQLATSMENGLIDEAGVWRVSARITSATAVLTSDPIRFLVTARID